MLASNNSLDFYINISAPGKVILHGEHSVVYDKLAVAASLGLRTRISLKSLPHTSDLIQIEFSSLDLSKSFSLQDLKTNLLDKLVTSNWENPDTIQHEELLKLIDVYLNKTCENLKAQQKFSLSSFLYLFTAIIGSAQVHVRPFLITLTTDLSISSGCGSSASFAVCLAGAFIRYVLLEKSGQNEELLNPDFDKKQLELISKWAFMAEKIIHGLPSGIDNTICTYGSVLSFRKSGGHKLLNTGEIKLLLVNTNVKRDTKRMVDVALSFKREHPNLFSLILGALEEISNSAINYLEQIHTVSDNELKLKEAYCKLGKVADINQHLLQALGVSHPTLDRICVIVKKKGLCGKLTGAGGGGYAIAVVPPYIADTVINEVIDELKAEGFDAVLTNSGGMGVSIN